MGNRSLTGDSEEVTGGNVTWGQGDLGNLGAGTGFLRGGNFS